MTYKELMNKMQCYVNYLDKKFTHHLNTTNKTIELYVDYKNDDKGFTDYINKRYEKEQKTHEKSKQVSEVSTDDTIS